MDDNYDDEDLRTVWCGNLSDKVTEEILYELFLQAGPLERVQIPRDKSGRYFNYGFITFKHQCSVPYAIDLLNNVYLYGKGLNLKPRRNLQKPDENTVQQTQQFVNNFVPQFENQMFDMNQLYMLSGANLLSGANMLNNLNYSTAQHANFLTNSYNNYAATERHANKSPRYNDYKSKHKNYSKRYRY